MRGVYRVGCFEDACEELPFPSWKRGEARRERIVEMLNQNPNVSVQEIAEGVELSIYQVKRHLSKLKKNIF